MLRREGLETDSELMEFEEHARHLLRQLEPVEEEEVDGGDDRNHEDSSSAAGDLSSESIVPQTQAVYARAKGPLTSTPLLSSKPPSALGRALQSREHLDEYFARQCKPYYHPSRYYSFRYYFYIDFIA